MAIPTSRAKAKGEIRIDAAKCSGCGLCVSVCKDFSLKLENGIAAVSDTPAFGCIACGHCMAICPTGAIEILFSDARSRPMTSSRCLTGQPPPVTAACWRCCSAAAVSVNSKRNRSGAK